MSEGAGRVLAGEAASRTHGKAAGAFTHRRARFESFRSLRPRVERQYSMACLPSMAAATGQRRRCERRATSAPHAST